LTKKEKLEIGNRLYGLRYDLVLSQRALAKYLSTKKLKILYSNISELEAGKSNPGIKLMMALGEKLNVNLNWFLRGIGRTYLPKKMTE